MNSIWTNTVKMPEFPALEKDIRTRVLIIGGGLTGLLCAYFLQEAGVDYCLLEADKICQGKTCGTTAKITVSQGMAYEKILSRFGQEKAMLFLKANEKALKHYKNLGSFLDADMEEKDFFLYTQKDRRKLESEIQVLSSLGASVDFVEKTALPFEIEGAIRYPQQAQFHPLKFAAGLAKNLKIYEHSEVREMTEYFALTESGSVAAEKIIVATHFPFINKRGAYYMKMHQQRGNVIALKNAPDLEGMYLKAEKERVSLRNYKDFLILGTGGHRTGKREGEWDALRETAKEYFPEANEMYFWANQDCMSLDGVPYIGNYGKSTPDLFVATGYNKWGMTGAMMAAMVLTDLVQEKENEYAAIFKTSRSWMRAQLFANIFESVKGIGNVRGEKRCSHMGCVLQWNADEQTWDCPCHGSRFTESGKRLDNPSMNDLKK